MELNLRLNEFQSTPEELELDRYPEEIQQQFYEFMTEVEFIRLLVSPDIKRARDLERDSSGKIIVDITKPHIFEDMDYFRPTAIYYKNHGKVCPYSPNSNPNSEYGKWLKEEIRRCWEGYVRESDGEWITGDHYFFLNYCPILVNKIQVGKKKALRVWGFPDFWAGHYYKFHYIQQARERGNHGAELASRGVGKSYTLASMAGKRFILGEEAETTREVKCFIAAYKKEYLTKDGVLTKFKSYIDFCTQNTQFPNKRIKDSMNEMQWISGYLDLDTNTRKGTLNEVIGVSVKDDEAKLRGKRGALIGLEEFGSFPNLLKLYGTLRPSMESGDYVYGLIYMQGTSGDDDADFAAAQEIMYNPKGYNVYHVRNVYDTDGHGKPNFVYFFPAYLNREGCFDKNSNPDVTKALLELLRNRYTVKYNSSDILAITKAISEYPITPQEAILRTRSNMFPVTNIMERLNQLDGDPKELDSIRVGELAWKSNGELTFTLSENQPIRDFPLNNNMANGAIEFYEFPEKGPNGKVYSNRYIVGYDPADNDAADTLSLHSIMVLDLWTDRIVAEFTGRRMYADDNYEIARMLTIFYNAIIMYENDKKGFYSYMGRMNCTHLIADMPEHLKSKDNTRIYYGNNAKGFPASKGLNNHANELIKDWLLKPVAIQVEVDGEAVEKTIPNLMFLKNRALLKELLMFNPVINVDRIRALGAVMIYREELMAIYGGEIKENMLPTDVYVEDPTDFFGRNWRGGEESIFAE